MVYFSLYGIWCLEHIKDMNNILMVVGSDPLLHVVKDLKMSNNLDYVFLKTCYNAPLNMKKNFGECLFYLQEKISNNIYDYLFPTIDGFSLFISYLNERYNLPGIRSYTASKIMSKFSYYQIFDSLNIPYPKIYTKVDSNGITNYNDIKYPCIIKPTNKAGGADIQILLDCYDKNQAIDNLKFQNEADLKYFFGDNIKYIQKEEFIIQGYIDGDVCSCMGIIKDGTIQIDLIFDIIPAKGIYPAEVGLHYPSKYAELKTNITNYIEKFFDNIKLDNSPFMFDIVIKDNQMFFIDFGARISSNPLLLLYYRKINYGSYMINKIINDIDYKIEMKKTSLMMRNSNNAINDSDLFKNGFDIT